MEEGVGTTGHKIDPNGVNHAGHYNTHPSGVEVIEIVRHMSFDLGNAFKYVARHMDKGATVKDLKKADWYFQDYVKCSSSHYPGTFPLIAQEALDRYLAAEKNYEVRTILKTLASLDQQGSGDTIQIEMLGALLYGYLRYIEAMEKQLIEAQTE